MAGSTDQFSIPPEFQQEIVVKFSSDVVLPFLATAVGTLADQAGSSKKILESLVPGFTLDPYFFSLPEGGFRELLQRSWTMWTNGRGPRLDCYFSIICPPNIDAEWLASFARNLPGVELAYVAGGPVPPPVQPFDDGLNALQRYQDPAPLGIGARQVWDRTDGTGIGFIDIEQGWALEHRDLAAASIQLLSGVNAGSFGHGTSVLGIVAARDNKLDGIGIAPNVTARVVSQWRTTAKYNTADAILFAAASMVEGDVLLLEAQTKYPPHSKYVPVEVEPAVYDAIRTATQELGIVVVEAAGNGGADLDAYVDENGDHVLKRSFRDSGALLVGAANSAGGHGRTSLSNFGSRVDCFAWGDRIDTCGAASASDTTGRDTDFGFTSGASAIVAGAATLLQSWRLRWKGGRYSPLEIRTLLSNPGLNTPSRNAAADLIGVMPNLVRVIAQESALP